MYGVTKVLGENLVVVASGPVEQTNCVQANKVVAVTPCLNVRRLLRPHSGARDFTRKRLRSKLVGRETLGVTLSQRLGPTPSGTD